MFAPQQAHAPQAANSNSPMVETEHQDVIHDAQFDFYGKRLATCSSDRVIKVFDVDENGQARISAQLTGHEGPVWQVGWAHPKFGNILGSCGYDKRVCVWKETNPQQWILVYQYQGHEASVNSFSFCPHELGLCVAAASSDGSISVLSWKGSQDNDWDENRFGELQHAHQIGCTSVSWAPPGSCGAAASPGAAQLQRRFVSGGCDNLVKVWSMDERGQWTSETLRADASHTDWVRSVAWAPSIGNATSVIASSGADKTVIIWTQNSGHWTSKMLPRFDQSVWRVSWNLSGSLLAVSSGDSKVTTWKQGDDGEWRCIETVVDSSQ